MKGTINLDGLAASFLGGWTGAGGRRSYRLSVVLTIPRHGDTPAVTQSVHEGSGPRQAWVMASLWMQLRAAHSLESSGKAVKDSWESGIEAGQQELQNLLEADRQRGVSGIAAAAKQAIGQLTPREREVLRERFGGSEE